MPVLLLLTAILLGACSDTKVPAKEEEPNAAGPAPAEPSEPKSPPETEAKVGGADRVAIDAGRDPQNPYPERRLEPGAAGTPTHATLRLLRKLGDKEWDLDPLLNPSRGLVIIRDTGEEKRSVQRYCGDRLAQGKKQVHRYLEQVLDRIKYDDDHKISCSNKPRPPRCQVPMLGHDFMALDFRFDDGERGIELVAVLELDQGALSDAPEALEKSVREQAEKDLAPLLATTCK